MKQKRLSKAIYLAATYHNNQFDKGGVPYIFHCIKVMQNLNSDDEELNCIAILHDILEDTQCTIKILESNDMSDRIIKGVLALTKKSGIKAIINTDDYLSQILKNEDAIKVKIADLKHNSDITRLKGITDKDFDRMKKYYRMFEVLKTK